MTDQSLCDHLKTDCVNPDRHLYELLDLVQQLTTELDAIRSLLDCDPDESTLDAVLVVHTEWRHYSRETDRLHAERDHCTTTAGEP